ncbi:hypothetical protein [Microlunatus endophyticus]|uniref:hypothetical protein n=1 Tax=Microlunatus endophyticus TaxID=1716077 RepID=UPI0016628F91|nr:hypothetical protein [Microlunatus endophyticus]
MRSWSELFGGVLCRWYSGEQPNAIPHRELPGSVMLPVAGRRPAALRDRWGEWTGQRSSRAVRRRTQVTQRGPPMGRTNQLFILLVHPYAGSMREPRNGHGRGPPASWNATAT